MSSKNYNKINKSTSQTKSEKEGIVNRNFYNQSLTSQHKIENEKKISGRNNNKIPLSQKKSEKGNNKSNSNISENSQNKSSSKNKNNISPGSHNKSEKEIVEYNESNVDEIIQIINEDATNEEGVNEEEVEEIGDNDEVIYNEYTEGYQNILEENNDKDKKNDKKKLENKIYKSENINENDTSKFQSKGFILILTLTALNISVEKKLPYNTINKIPQSTQSNKKSVSGSNSIYFSQNSRKSKVTNRSKVLNSKNETYESFKESFKENIEDNG